MSMKHPGERVWLLAIFLGLIVGVLLAVSPEFWMDPRSVINDDGRHFTVWLRAQGDPALFAGDRIADYAGGLTPALYKLMFRPAAWLGIDVVVWQVLVIVPLTCALTILAARALLRMVLPEGAWIGPTLLVLFFMIAEWPIAGIPRAFGFAILFGALAAFFARRALLLAVIMGVGTSLYPAAAIVAGGAMGLSMLRPRAPWIVWEKRGWALIGIAAAAGLAGLAVYVWQAEDSGPVFTLAQARGMPIFQSDGRTAFFNDSVLEQVLCDGRGGMLPLCISGIGAFGAVLMLLVTGLVIWGGWVATGRHPAFGRLMLTLCASGLVFYGVSYLIAFNAHLPGRYAFYGIGAAFMVAVAALCGAVLRWGVARWSIPLSLVMAVGVVALVVRAQGEFKAMHDKSPAFTAFLRDTPPETLVAGFAPSLDDIPSFAQRPVYFARELLIPYKVDYYTEMMGRITGLATALASNDAGTVAAYAGKHGIDYLVIGPFKDRWSSSFPALGPLFAAMTTDWATPCIRARSGRLMLVEVACLAE